MIYPRHGSKFIHSPWHNKKVKYGRFETCEWNGKRHTILFNLQPKPCLLWTWQKLASVLIIQIVLSLAKNVKFGNELCRIRRDRLDRLPRAGLPFLIYILVSFDTVGISCISSLLFFMTYINQSATSKTEKLIKKTRELIQLIYTIWILIGEMENPSLRFRSVLY